MNDVVTAAPDSIDTFAAMLDSDLPPITSSVAPDKPKQGTQNTSDPVEPQLDTATKPDEEPLEESEGIDETGDEPEEATDDEEIAVKADDIEVELPDGSKQKIALDELKKGYFRQSDYSKKTAEIAELRKAHEAEFETTRQHQVAVLTALNEELNRINPLGILEAQYRRAIDDGDDTLAQKLRLDMIETKEHLEKRQRALQWEFEQSTARQTEKEAKEEAEFMETQRSLILQKLPLLSKDEGREKFRNTVAKAMEKAGYTPEEAAAIKKPDHRQALLAYWAGQHLASQAARPQVAELLKGKAVAPSPGARNPSAGKNNKADVAYRNLAKNPRNTDAFGAWLNASGV